MYSVAFRTILFTLSIAIISPVQAQKDSRKSYLEDIFIWKMTDELKLSVAEEKKFSGIQKELNQQKIELNKNIQNSIESLILAQTQKQTQIILGKQLNQHAVYLRKYNNLALKEFSEMRKLLGAQRLVEYLRIKSELNNKMKSLLAGENEKNNLTESKTFEKMNDLPPPLVIIEK